MTVSHWRRSAGGAPVIECDAAVIGAGICGVSAALHLERMGVDVRIADRCSLGAGASSRNAGFLMRGAAENYALAVKDYGREQAKALWRLTEENLAGLRALGVEELPSYRAVPSALLALEAGELAELRASVPLMREDGLAVDWLDTHDDSAWASGKPLGALVNPHDGQVNPFDLLRLLAGKLRHPVLDHAEALEFAAAPGDRVDVRLPAATLRARWCFVCTNAYAPLLLPALAGKVVPRRGQMLAIPPAADASRRLRLDFSYYANRGSEYFRQTPDGTVVLGGCRTYHADRECGYDDAVTPWVQESLEDFGRSLFGSRWPASGESPLQTVARWSGVMGFTSDALPLIGTVQTPRPGLGEPAKTDSVWFIGGCTGHGMSMFHRVAEIGVRAAIAGDANPFPLSRTA